MQYVFSLFPSQSGASQVSPRGFQHMEGLGDPWEPPDGAFELLMASQVAREEAEQKKRDSLVPASPAALIFVHNHTQLPQVPHFYQPYIQAATQSTRDLNWNSLDITKQNTVIMGTGNRDEEDWTWESTQWSVAFRPAYSRQLYLLTKACNTRFK